MYSRMSVDDMFAMREDSIASIVVKNQDVKWYTCRPFKKKKG